MKKVNTAQKHICISLILLKNTFFRCIKFSRICNAAKM